MTRGKEFDAVVAWCEAHGMDHVIALELAAKAFDGVFDKYHKTIDTTKRIGSNILPAEIYQGFWEIVDYYIEYKRQVNLACGIGGIVPEEILQKHKVFKFITEEVGLHTFIADRILELTPVDKLETIDQYNGVTSAFDWDDTLEDDMQNAKETLWWWIDDIIIGNTEYKTLPEIYARWNKIHPTKQIPINEYIKEKEMEPMLQQTITKAIDILGEEAVLKLLEENMQLEQWKTMPIDTKIEVKGDNGEWVRRYFLGIDLEHNLPTYFSYGKTSFTADEDDISVCVAPENIRLYKE